MRIAGGNFTRPRLKYNAWLPIDGRARVLCTTQSKAEITRSRPAGATGFGDSGHRGTTGRGEARRWNDRSRDPRRESLTRAAPRKDTAELAPAAAISCSCPASAIPRLLSHRALADQIQAARATLSPTSSQLGRPAASGSAGGTAGRVPCMIGRSLDRSVLRLPLAGRDQGGRRTSQ
jgi:hypothetical protein